MKFLSIFLVALLFVATASTGSDGTVRFQLRNAGSGCYTTDVTSVNASGLSYDGSEPANGFCK